jgi:hypothetical protein
VKVDGVVFKKGDLVCSATIGRNVYSMAHGDKDSGPSTLKAVGAFPDVKDGDITGASVSANLDPHCDLMMQCVMFPVHGLAIPLFPTTNLVFNSIIPHCVSEVVDSPALQHAEVYLTTCYLKSQIVGGNDNDVPLTEDEEACLAAVLPDVQEQRKRRRTTKWEKK